MRFTGEHETVWRFSRPVFLEPHLVRLIPRQDRFQSLESFSMAVAPEPAGRCEITDTEGNQACWLWFEGLHPGLSITTRFAARTLRPNPFDYLLCAGAGEIPPALPPRERVVLDPCLVMPPAARKAERLGRELAEAAGGDAISFLGGLTAWLYANIAVEARPEPGIQSPDATLDRGRGACRDTALVFMAACRGLGIPARFVSCYQAGDAGQTERDLHACAEVYLPGAGWRGYDPTLGLAVSDAHLALCASAKPGLTVPVKGTFRGTGAVGEMTFRIDLSVRD